MLGESLYISGKYLDFKGKSAEAQSKATSLSSENELLKGQITALFDEAKKDKDRLTVLEKSIDTEKAFLRLKAKQIDEALLKVKKAGIKVVEKFKASNEYLNKLCNYYIEGFELFRKYMGKHHPELDFADLGMEVIENEVLVDRQSVEKVGEGSEIAVVLEKFIHIFIFFWARCFKHVYLLSLEQSFEQLIGLFCSEYMIYFELFMCHV